MKDTIEIGDIVNIKFENCTYLFDVEILGIPIATSDSWKCKGKDRTIYYIQNYAIIVKHSSKQS